MRHARRIVLLATLAVVGLGFAAVAASRAGNAQEPQAVPGTAAIWTDQSSYDVGNSVHVCYRIPVPGDITITNIPPGSQPVFYSGPSNGTQGCMPGIITPPSGTQCLQLSYPLLGGQGQTQTCFHVSGGGPGPGALRIYTDSQYYTVGEPIDVCYRVPQPGPVTILDQVNENTPTTFYSGYDDGTGACIPGTIVPPTGRECLSIQFTYPSGQQITSQTCFQTAP